MTRASPAWTEVSALVDRIAADGGPVEFWLRDDDATEPSAALDRLLDLTAEHRVPLALAVIPAGATEALARRLEPLDHVSVLQHGWAHKNHAAPKAKKRELGPERPADVVVAEIAEGAKRLEPFARREAVMVPPWNRIAAGVVRRLPGLGFKALSQYRARPTDRPTDGIVRINTHLDPVVWRGRRDFRGEAGMLALLRRRLARIAGGRGERDEATGVLTHHLVHDADFYAFLADLLAFVREHPAARWVPVGRLVDTNSPGAGR